MFVEGVIRCLNTSPISSPEFRFLANLVLYTIGDVPDGGKIPDIITFWLGSYIDTIVDSSPVDICPIATLAGLYTNAHCIGMSALVAGRKDNLKFLALRMPCTDTPAITGIPTVTGVTPESVSTLTLKLAVSFEYRTVLKAYVMFFDESDGIYLTLKIMI